MTRSAAAIEAVIADGVQVLVKVSLFGADRQKVRTPKQPRGPEPAKMEHAIRHEIQSSWKKDRLLPVAARAFGTDHLADPRRRIGEAEQLSLLQGPDPRHAAMPSRRRRRPGATPALPSTVCSGAQQRDSAARSRRL